jgi:predicted pyridoxine 5'-phosphate oxidase superfamily flavin-nucleotide-binding protein
VAPSSDIAFSPAVKAIQARRGSRPAYARMEARGGWETQVTPALAAFLAEQESVILATVNAEGQPYAQHRGGPKGFIQVLDEKTLAFADFRGNRQYITQGNLAENPKAFIIAVDYLRRERVKIWGRARVIEDDAALIAQLPQGDRTKAEQAILFEVEAWDTNCPRYIPQMLPAGEVEAAIAGLQQRIRELEAENAALHAGDPDAGTAATGGRT